MNASVSHAHGLAAAGIASELWTGSPAAAERAEKLGVRVRLDPRIAAPLAPLWSRKAWAAARAAGPVAAVLHQGAKSWAWAWAFWPWATHAVRFPNYRIRDRRLFRNWMAVSTRHAADLARERTLGWRRPRVAAVKNGDAQSAAKRVADRRPFREDGRFVIGALGVLSDRKGQDLLIDALDELRRRGVDAEVRLGGPDGAAAESQKARARALGLEDRVAFLGWVDAVDFLATLDVFCLPSRSEPFGLVVIEAMAQGVPVVASDTDGPADILADDAGLLTPIGDAAALADALETLANDPERAAALARAGRHRALTDYRPAAVGQSLVDAFRHFGADLTADARPAFATGD